MISARSHKLKNLGKSAIALSLFLGASISSDAVEPSSFEKTLRSFKERTGGSAAWPNANDGTNPGAYPKDGYYTDHSLGGSTVSKFNDAVAVMMTYVEGASHGYWIDPEAYNGLIISPQSTPADKDVYSVLRSAYFTKLATLSRVDQFAEIQKLLKFFVWKKAFASGFTKTAISNGWTYNCTYPTNVGGDAKFYIGTRGVVPGFPTTPLNGSGGDGYRWVDPTGTLITKVNGVVVGEIHDWFWIYQPAFVHEPGGSPPADGGIPPKAKGSSSAPGACSPCQGDVCGPAEGKADTGCAHFTWSLGSSLFGDRAGSLFLHWETSDPGWYSPNTLTLATLPGFVRVNNTGGNLIQVYGPTVVADVTVVNSSRYQLKFFARAPGWTIGSDGRVQTSGTPNLIYDIENPNVGGSQNRLRITKNLGTSAEEWSEFEYTAASKQWKLTKSDDPVIETMTKPDWDANGERIIERTKAHNGNLVSKVQTKMKKFAWGEERIQEVIDPAGAALTTTWSYYSNLSTDGTNYGKLKQMTAPSGYWQLSTYDALKRLKTKTSIFLDGTQASDRQLLEITYPDDVTPAVDYTTYVTKIRAQEISRRYRKERWDGYDEYVCQTVGAAITASDNLVTHVTNYMNTNITTGALTGRPKATSRPDGTAVLYTYFPNQIDSNYFTIESATSLTTVAKEGAPNAVWPNMTSITSGTITTTISNVPGEVISTTVADIESGLTIAQDQVDGTSGVDGFGRPILVHHLNGTTTARSYDCCQLASETDAFGVVTLYERTESSNSTTRLGITTEITTAGLTATTVRTGTDSSQMTLQTTISDAAGRMASTAGGDNHATTYGYQYENGHLVITETHPAPDNGTIVTTHYLDGRVKSVTGTATAQPRRYAYDLDQNGLFTQTIALDGAGNDTSETTKSYVDAAGRLFRQVNSAGGVTLTTFNTKGQMIKTSDADGVTQLFDYDAQGRLTTTAVDMNQNGSIDYAGSDRITQVTPIYANKAGVTVSRVTTKIWDTLNANSYATHGVVEQGLSGLQSWNTSDTLTTTTTLSIPGTPNGSWTQTTTGPNGAQSLKNYSSGRLASEQKKDSTGTVIASLTYGYDAHGRLSQTQDGRGATIAYGYDAGDRIHTVTGPAATVGETPPVTTIDYDSMGRRQTVTDAANGTVTYAYSTKGAVDSVAGNRAYPISYTYTDQGRMSTMTTAAGITTWVYEASTGRLWKKLDAANKGAVFTYTTAGRLATKTNARGIIASYEYNTAGENISVTYNDGITPAVTTAFNRLGQAATIASGGVTETVGFNVWGQLESESFSGGPLSGLGLTHTYDALRRRTGLSSVLGSTGLTAQTFGYDNASRLATVTGGNESATYGYDANADLVTSVTLKDGGATRLTSQRSYDLAGRLEWIKSLNAQSQSLFESTYAYNNLDQRTSVTREDGTQWAWGYNDRGEVTSGGKKFSDGTSQPVLQFGYAYDGIGNRTSSSKGGSDAAHTASYSPNALNQYNSRTMPPYLAVTGEAASDTAVAVQAKKPQRKGTAFWREWSVDNATGPVRENVRVAAAKPGGGSNGADLINVETGKLYLPPATENFTYDDDGNLIGDSRWTYSWDAENRLLSMQENSATLPAGWTRERLEFSYDAGSRRVRKTVKQWDGSAWQTTSDTGFVYDGWNLVAELDLLQAPSPTLRASYCWGLDLSQSLQGAGGVSGLLWAQSASGGGYVHFAAYDGNGNVIGYLDATSGLPVLKLDYDPFGYVVMAGAMGDAASAAVARSIPFQFSTKYGDFETGLSYYGYRYYAAELGKWLSPDPIGEKGGGNLSCFLENQPTLYVDVFGLEPLLSPEQADAGKSYVDGYAREVGQGLLNAGGQIGFTLTPWGRVLKFFGLGKFAGALGGVAGKVAPAEIRGLYGTVSRAALEQAAKAAGETIPVVTRLAETPALGRALSVAAGEAREALAAAGNRCTMTAYRGNIPKALIDALETAGLVTKRLTSQNGVAEIEYRFLGAAAEFIIPFLK